MSSVGEHAERMTQGRRFPDHYSRIGARPLQALKEEIKKRLGENWRTVRLRLLLTESEHESLTGIGLTCARLFNELNYEEGGRSSRVSLQKRRTMRLTASTTTSIMRF
jgi:hypothetical protein